MKRVHTQFINPGEGIKIRKPNGDEAAKLLVTESATVDTFEDSNYVEVLIRFMKPFIKPKK